MENDSILLLDSFKVLYHFFGLQCIYHRAVSHLHYILRGFSEHHQFLTILYWLVL